MNKLILTLAIALVVFAPKPAQAEYYGKAHQLFTICFAESNQADKGLAGYCVGMFGGMISAAQLTDNGVDYCVPDQFSAFDGKELFRRYMHSHSDTLAMAGLYRPYQAFRAALVKYHSCEAK